MHPNRPKLSVDPDWIEFLIRFGLMPIAKKLTSEVLRSLVRCSTVFFFSLVTSSRWHNVSDLRGLSEVRQGHTGASLQLSGRWFFLLRQVHMHAWARGVGHGITRDRGLGKGSLPDLHSSTKNTSWALGHRPWSSRAAALGSRIDDRISVCWT